MTDEVIPNMNWNAIIPRLLYMTATYESAPAWALAIKLSEEVGELSEIMLHELGHLHLAVHYPDKTSGELSEELLAAMIKKGKKYGRVINAPTHLLT